MFVNIFGYQLFLENWFIFNALSPPTIILFSSSDTLTKEFKQGGQQLLRQRHKSMMWFVEWGENLRAAMWHALKSNSQPAQVLKTLLCEL